VLYKKLTLLNSLQKVILNSVHDCTLALHFFFLHNAKSYLDNRQSFKNDFIVVKLSETETRRRRSMMDDASFIT